MILVGVVMMIEGAAVEMYMFLGPGAAAGRTKARRLGAVAT
jgi:hypothetical protein